MSAQRCDYCKRFIGYMQFAEGVAVYGYTNPQSMWHEPEPFAYHVHCKKATHARRASDTDKPTPEAR